MMKQTTQSTEVDALWSIQVPAAILKECQDELVTLQKWKDEQLTVEATWDVQAVGNDLALPPGSPIRPQILPAIKILKAALEREQQDCAALRQMVRELRDAMIQAENDIIGDCLPARCYEAIEKANQLIP